MPLIPSTTFKTDFENIHKIFSSSDLKSFRSFQANLLHFFQKYQLKSEKKV